MMFQRDEYTAQEVTENGRTAEFLFYESGCIPKQCDISIFNFCAGITNQRDAFPYRSEGCAELTAPVYSAAESHG